MPADASGLRDTARRRYRGRPRHECTARIARERQLARACVLGRQCRGKLGGDVGVADHLQVAPSARIVLDAEHLLRRTVDELQPAVAVHHEDAFDHAGEDGVGPRVIARELLDAAPELLRGGVEHAGDRPQFIATVVAHTAREIAGRVATGGRRDRLHAAPEGGGECPGDD